MSGGHRGWSVQGGEEGFQEQRERDGADPHNSRQTRHPVFQGLPQDLQLSTIMAIKTDPVH